MSPDTNSDLFYMQRSSPIIGWQCHNIFITLYCDLALQTATTFGRMLPTWDQRAPFST